jgi:hypothetical protein
MKRILILLSLYCFVIAQYDESGTYPDDYPGGSLSADGAVMQPQTPTPEPSPAQSGSYTAESTPVSRQYSSSPELSPSTSGGSSLGNEDIPDDLEARIGKTPDIPLFSHRAHIEDVGAECVQCHQTLFAELVRGYKIGPPMKEICGQCHNGETAREEVLAGFTNEKKYVKPTMPLFSHTKHIQYTERCYTCHRDVYGELKKIKKVPPMSLCVECHNNHQANSDCKVCHENVNELKPVSHTPRWLCRNGHGVKARFAQDKCSECHTDRECDACHRGQSSFAVHRPGYRYAHGMDARQRVANCTYCHDSERSCAQCHMRSR